MVMIVFPLIFFLPAVFIHRRRCFRLKFVINRARARKERLI